MEWQSELTRSTRRMEAARMPDTIPITLAVMQPRRPRKGSHWLLAFRLRLDNQPASVPEAEMYMRSGVRVLSSLELAELPDGAGIGPQWHVSISRYPQRAAQRDVERALRDFGMLSAEEDNHEPGTAKHFWLPLDAEHRVECQCKHDEVLVVEADGHAWSNSRESGECRGCAYGRQFGKACPLHAGSVAL